MTTTKPCSRTVPSAARRTKATEEHSGISTSPSDVSGRAAGSRTLPGARRPRLRALPLTFLCASAFVQHASASEPDRAELLFQTARELMGRNEFAAACPMLEEAYALDHGDGTLLAAALCHEGNGKPATALREFHESLTRAARANRPNRVMLAESHLRSLAATVPRLRIRFAAVPVPGAAISVDGDPIDAATAGVGLEVNPGTHEIVASAPGFLSWRHRVEVVAGSEPPIVEVRALVKASPLPVPDMPSPPKSSPRPRIWGLTVGGLGLVAVGFGCYFGAEAFTTEASSRHDCAGTQCSLQGVSLNHQAKQDAVVSDVTFAAGGAAMVGGSLLLSLRRIATAGGARPTVALQLGAPGVRAGLSVAASW